MLQAGDVAAIIAERAVRTPKYLFGIVSGCAIVKPAHLQVGGLLEADLMLQRTAFHRGFGSRMGQLGSWSGSEQCMNELCCREPRCTVLERVVKDESFACATAGVHRSWQVAAAAAGPHP